KDMYGTELRPFRAFIRGIFCPYIGRVPYVHADALLGLSIIMALGAYKNKFRLILPVQFFQCPKGATASTWGSAPCDIKPQTTKPHRGERKRRCHSPCQKYMYISFSAPSTGRN